MRAHTPQDQTESGPPNQRPPSFPNRFRASSRPQTSLRESRGPSSYRATQPTYDFLAGESAAPRPGSRQSHAPAQSQRPSSRESSKENVAPPDAEEYESQRRIIEEQRAEIGTLRYKISTFEQDRDLATARHNAELEDQKRRANEDFEKKQAAESEKAKSQRQLESVEAELKELRESIAREKDAYERRIRDAEERNQEISDQLDEVSTAKDDAERMQEKKLADVRMQLDAAQRSVQELEAESQSRELVLQRTQAQVTERDGQIAQLETDILKLKAQTGDADTIAVIRHELTEQVQHIRTLETTNREYLTELKHLRQMNKAVEVVEEEKRSLIRKLEAAQLLETELAEAQMQRQRLQDERLAWTSFLQSASEENNSSEMQFESPEDVARALVQERLVSASHLERLGQCQAEIASQQATIEALTRDKAALKLVVEKAKTTAASADIDKTRARLERQRTLAHKEIEHLRAQLKTFDAEDLTFNTENYDKSRAERIQQLEDLVDQHKVEIQTLHTELASRESGSTPPQPLATGKRQRSVEPSDNTASQEQLGQLARKVRKLQDELTTVQTRLTLRDKELKVSKEQLAAAKKQTQVRVLALRSNPTSDHEAIKLSTLQALRKENTDLLAHIRQNKSTYPTIPESVLPSYERRVEEARAETAAAQKSARRLKEVWASKSAEFKEAIFSTLGWTVTFIPNGKMRVESVFFPSLSDEHENSIVFDGEKGTMKVGGGPRSPFAHRIADQIRFWVREKGCIPGFLAALTLEFYEEQSRASAGGDTTLHLQM